MIKKIIIDKKGIILKEVITLIISVLCLIILFYLGSQLYGMLIKKSALEQAKANLEQISNTINNLKDGSSGTFLLTSPKNWFLILYNKGTGLFSCSGNSCICFCPAETLESCEKEGVCKDFGLNIDSRPPLKITKFYDLEFVRGGDVIKGYNKVHESRVDSK
ncbi:hypothetical protein J4429_03090 [Candidatus Pacearchaeota archaeon]|nr:hypothetical protein [Candidatus Pacearchaeota archaeon]